MNFNNNKKKEWSLYKSWCVNVIHFILTFIRNNHFVSWIGVIVLMNELLSRCESADLISSSLLFLSPASSSSQKDLPLPRKSSRWVFALCFRWKVGKLRTVQLADRSSEIANVLLPVSFLFPLVRLCLFEEEKNRRSQSRKWNSILLEWIPWDTKTLQQLRRGLCCFSNRTGRSWWWYVWFVWVQVVPLVAGKHRMKSDSVSVCGADSLFLPPATCTSVSA